MKRILDFVKLHIPFEIKRPSSPVSIILALVIIGFFGKIGEKLLDILLNLFTPLAPEILKVIKVVVSYSIPINLNLLTLMIFVLLFFPVYRFFDKKLLQRLGKTIIFEDDFDFGNQGWVLNYWGSTNPDKTCRIEKSILIFEAEDAELTDPRKEFGAYFDLTNGGVYQGSKYEISCWVKSENNTSMGFKLWVHDTRGQSNVKFPANFYTPSMQFEEVKVGFTATSSNALRIHLHNKPGSGKIIIDKVRVVKVK